MQNREKELVNGKGQVREHVTILFFFFHKFCSQQGKCKMKAKLLRRKVNVGIGNIAAKVESMDAWQKEAKLLDGGKRRSEKKIIQGGRKKNDNQMEKGNRCWITGEIERQETITRTWKIKSKKERQEDTV